MLGVTAFPAIAVQKTAGDKKKYVYEGEMNAQRTACARTLTWRQESGVEVGGRSLLMHLVAGGRARAARRGQRTGGLARVRASRARSRDAHARERGPAMAGGFAHARGRSDAHTAVRARTHACVWRACAALAALIWQACGTRAGGRARAHARGVLLQRGRRAYGTWGAGGARRARTARAASRMARAGRSGACARQDGPAPPLMKKSGPTERSSFWSPFQLRPRAPSSAFAAALGYLRPHAECACEMLRRISQFIADVDVGRVAPKLKSEPVPPAIPGGVLQVVGSTVQSAVFTPSKDVLLEVYAPWCGPAWGVWARIGGSISNANRVSLASDTRQRGAAHHSLPQLNPA